MSEDYKLHGEDMLVDDSNFRVVHPGPMVRDELTAKRLTTQQAALLMGVDPQLLEPALAGHAPFDAPLLDGLATVISPGFAALVRDWEAERKVSASKPEEQ